MFCSGVPETSIWSQEGLHVLAMLTMLVGELECVFSVEDAKGRTACRLRVLGRDVELALVSF